MSARAGCDVTVCEVNEAYAENALGRVRKSLARAEKSGKLTTADREAAEGRIRTVTDIAELADRDLVVEAVVEDEAEKIAIFLALGKVARPDALLASNTSSIPIMKLAAVTPQPQRVIGMHFFNPVPVLRLVELVPSPLTSPETVRRAEAFSIGQLDKHIVHCKDRAGFVVNALLVPYLLASIRMVESGFASAAEVDTGMVDGCNHPMGPLALCDLIGLDTIHDQRDAGRQRVRGRRPGRDQGDRRGRGRRSDAARGQRPPAPRWTPGAHADLILGEAPTRQYSLCGDPADQYTWRVGILRDANGRGGSLHVHDRLQAGDTIRVRGPRNNFPLEPSPRYLFIAGGIGITPILTMIAAAETAGAEWELVYGGRQRASMAFLDELAAYGDRVTVSPQDEAGLLDLPSILGTLRPGTLAYCCGPEPLLAAVEQNCKAWPAKSLHVERFAAKPVAEPARAEAFEVRLAQSDLTLTVAPERSILDVIEEAGIAVSAGWWPASPGARGDGERRQPRQLAGSAQRNRAGRRGGHPVLRLSGLPEAVTSVFPGSPPPSTPSSPPPTSASSGHRCGRRGPTRSPNASSAASAANSSTAP